jgi:hypothetical protein
MDELIRLDRRNILRATTGILAGLVVAGSPLALIARGKAWAIDLTAFTTPEGATLLTAARTMMPHDKLDDAAYALVVHAVDGDASRDELVRRIFKEGVAGLGGGFATSTEDERIAVLKKRESSEFFKSLRLKTVQILYSTPLAYAYFGYEGEAFSKGGYLLRGFNDLKWLPEVPLADSGTIPVSK